jgi:hypothetical protein
VAGIKQSGEHFNIKTYSTVASTIVRVKGMIETEKRVPEKIENIDRVLDKSQKKT